MYITQQNVWGGIVTSD